MRYFPNPYPDYSSQSPPPDLKVYLTKAKMVAGFIIENIKQVEEISMDGGLYVGPAGVAYAFWKLSRFVSPAESQELLKRAGNLVNLNLMHVQRPDLKNDKQNQVGFLLGSSGVQAVAALIYKACQRQNKMEANIQSFTQIAKDRVLVPSVVHRCGSDELFVGRAGYLSGALWLNSELKSDIVPQTDLFLICNSIVQSGREYVRRKGSRKQVLPPLMYSYYDTEYLGAAHGLCAILQMLITVPGYIQHCCGPDDVKDIKDSVDFLLGLQTPSGNFPCAMDEAPPYKQRPDSEELVHWCHGAPGVVYLLVRAYLVWNEEKYLTGALKCGECLWNKGLLKKGPGICHGVAGSGYVFLLLHRLTGDPKHLYRATKFADFLDTDTFKNEARKPDCPFSLYEGWAGTLCFLLDLSQPDQAHFPFSEVF